MNIQIVDMYDDETYESYTLIRTTPADLRELADQLERGTVKTVYLDEDEDEIKLKVCGPSIRNKIVGLLDQLPAGHPSRRELAAAQAMLDNNGEDELSADAQAWLDDLSAKYGNLKAS